MIIENEKIGLTTPEEMCAYHAGLRDQFNDDSKVMVMKHDAETAHLLGVAKGIMIGTIINIVATVGTLGVYWAYDNRFKIKVWFKTKFKKKH